MIKYLVIFIIFSCNLSAEWIPSNPNWDKDIDLLYYSNCKYILNEGQLRTDHFSRNENILFGYLGNSIISIRYKFHENHTLLAFCPYKICVYQNNTNNEIYDTNEYDIYVCLFSNYILFFKACISGANFDINKTECGQDKLYNSKLSFNLLMRVDSFSVEYVKK